MEKLFEKKRRIEEEIRRKNELNNNTRNELSQITQKLSQITEIIKNEKKRLYCLDNKLNEKIKRIEYLKKKIIKYTNEKRVNIKDRLEKSYVMILRSVNMIPFKNLDGIAGDFTILSDIIKEAQKFPILYNQLNALRIKKKKDALTKFIARIDLKCELGDTLHESSYYIALIIELEDIFNEKILCEHLFALIYEEFNYNFMSSRKTNRLDKPEWFIKSILASLSTYKRLASLYDSIKTEGNIMESLLVKINQLFIIKLDECNNTSSAQRRSLVHHFANEYMAYKSTTIRMYKADIKLDYLTETIIMLEREMIEKEIYQINLENHRSWFKRYDKLLNESCALTLQLSYIDQVIFSVVTQHVLDTITTYCRILTEQMRINTKKEVNLLGCIFSGIEDLKMCSMDKESIFLITFSPHNYKGIDYSKMSLLNSEIFKRVKCGLELEISGAFKKLSNFIYLSDKTISHITVDIYNILDEYNENMKKGFKTLENTARDICDDIILNQFFIRCYFKYNELLRFKEFYLKIKERFSVSSNWKSDVGLKCVEEIINGKTSSEGSSALFKLIYKNYLN